MIQQDRQTGYSQLEYVQSLREFGQSIYLPRSEGWLLKRAIPGIEGFYDAMGPYPLFSCEDWNGLGGDLQEWGEELVSTVLVTDPFAEFDLDYLRQGFNRGLIPFKEHFVVDLEHDPIDFVGFHHQRNVAKALNQAQIERVEDPQLYLEDWTKLYQNLIERHSIQGIAQFSEASFECQLQTPGMVMYRAVAEGETIGMVLWFLAGDVGYYHLAAYSEEGYRRRSSFALFWTALHDFKREVRWLGLGAGSGLVDSDDGLTRFKRGWATGTKTVYLGRHIGNLKKYEELTRSYQLEESSFFPAYRACELPQKTVEVKL